MKKKILAISENTAAMRIIRIFENFLTNDFDLVVHENIFEGKPYEVISNHHPDVLLTGIADPMNRELEYMHFAKEMNIPVVGVSDIWNAHTRVTSTFYTKMLVFDEYDKHLAHEWWYNPDDVIIIGDPFLDEVRQTLTSSHTAETRRRIDYYVTEGGHAGSIVLLGQDPEMTKVIIDFTVQCMNADSETWFIFPCFHPKFGDEVGRYLFNYLRKQFPSDCGLAPRGFADTDVLIAATDKTVSVFSGGLKRAAYSNVCPISIEVTETQVRMNDSIMHISYPLVEMGLCHKMTTPRPLSVYDPVDSTGYRNLTKFRPDVVRQTFHELTT